MIKIGLTGGIGSGKSFIARIFHMLGIPVYYADYQAKRLMNKDKDLKTAIKKLLGTEAYHRNGQLNRAFVAQLIFNDNKLLKKMNALVHPAVRNDFDQWARTQKAPYVIEESALLFEIRGQQYFDAVILVVADEELRIERVMNRDNLSRKEIKARMSKQLKDPEKIQLADFIIDNNGNKSILRQVLKVHKQILQR